MQSKIDFVIKNLNTLSECDDFHCLNNGLVLFIDNFKHDMFLYNSEKQVFVAQTKISRWTKFLLALGDSFIINSGTPQKTFLVCATSLKMTELTQTFNSYATFLAINKQQFIYIDKQPSSPFIDVNLCGPDTDFVPQLIISREVHPDRGFTIRQKEGKIFLEIVLPEHAAHYYSLEIFKKNNSHTYETIESINFKLHSKLEVLRNDNILTDSFEDVFQIWNGSKCIKKLPWKKLQGAKKLDVLYSLLPLPDGEHFLIYSLGEWNQPARLYLFNPITGTFRNINLGGYYIRNSREIRICPNGQTVIQVFTKSLTKTKIDEKANYLFFDFPELAEHKNIVNIKEKYLLFKETKLPLDVQNTIFNFFTPIKYFENREAEGIHAPSQNHVDHDSPRNSNV